MWTEQLRRDMNATRGDRFRLQRDNFANCHRKTGTGL
jgi:hypothetical protein